MFPPLSCVFASFTQFPPFFFFFFLKLPTLASYFFIGFASPNNQTNHIFYLPLLFLSLHLRLHCQQLDLLLHIFIYFLVRSHCSFPFRDFLPPFAFLDIPFQLHQKMQGDSFSLFFLNFLFLFALILFFKISLHWASTFCWWDPFLFSPLSLNRQAESPANQVFSFEYFLFFFPFLFRLGSISSKFSFFLRGCLPFFHFFHFFIKDPDVQFILPLRIYAVPAWESQWMWLIGTMSSRFLSLSFCFFFFFFLLISFIWIHNYLISTYLFPSTSFLYSFVFAEQVSLSINIKGFLLGPKYTCPHPVRTMGVEYQLFPPLFFLLYLFNSISLFFSSLLVLFLFHCGCYPEGKSLQFSVICWTQSKFWTLHCLFFFTKWTFWVWISCAWFFITIICDFSTLSTFWEFPVAMPNTLTLRFFSFDYSLVHFLE